MPTCVHCGKSAGLFRSYHAECRAQFERATTTIPLFYEKLLHSYLAPDKFDRLLKEVAANFHIGADELRTLSISGVNAMVKAALAQHLMTPAEEERILEVLSTVGLSTSDVADLEDKLVKITVLRDLDDGKIPDLVTVVGPMPVELKPKERIIWIFNQVKRYRRATTGDSEAPAPAPMRHDMPSYFSPDSLGSVSARKEGFKRSADVDLVITNQHVCVISDKRQSLIPLSKIASFDTYSDGFQITRARAEHNPLTFIVDDPWFAANLIMRLLRKSSNSAVAPREITPASATERTPL